MWPASLRLFACLDFDPCTFFPFLGCFLFMKFGRVSSSSYFLHALEKVTNFRLRANNSMHIQSFLCQRFQLCQKRMAQLYFTHISFFPNTIASLGNLVRLFIPVYPVIKKMVGYQQGSQGRLLIISIRIEQKPRPFGIYSIETHRDPSRSGIPLMIFLKNDPKATRIYFVCEICSHRAPSIFKVGYFTWTCG